MSQFRTTLDSVIVTALAKLPKGSVLESVNVTSNKKGVELVWSHPDFKTGYLTPFEWTEQQLQDQVLPAGVNPPKVVVELPQTPPQVEVPPAPPLTIKVDTKPTKSVKAKK